MRSVPAKVLIAIADHRLRLEIGSLFFDKALSLLEACRAADVAPLISRHDPQVVILSSVWNDSCDGLAVAQLIRSTQSTLPIILLAQRSSEALAIAALKAGVDDYFAPPWPKEEIQASVQRCLALSSRDCFTRDRIARDPDAATPRGLIGESAAIHTATQYLIKVAQTDINVLITGETGTGKELAAQLVHANSARSKQSFVCVNCAAIPDSLFESELFGHEKGAFTGALVRKDGYLKQADKGTVFFDEIGDMNQYVQAKLLRAIESRTVFRLGGRETVPFDIRIIAATNRDLERSVAEGTFRRDLYFRVNVARVQLPPLRERKEDIILLADHFRREMNARFRRDVEGYETDLVDAFLRYDWPGNVRELRNVIEATYIDLPSRRISLAHLPKHVRDRLSAIEETAQTERDRLLAALIATNWNMSKAAQKLQWSRMTLYRKTAKYHISRHDMVDSSPPTAPTLPVASHV